MAIKKIPCGGWLYDDEQIKFEDGVIRVIGGGGESAPEVENAIETHGLGWTDTEEKAGFDIQWDGNTEGLDYVPIVETGGGYYKVSDVLDIMNPIDNLIGAHIIGSNGESGTVTAEDILTEDNKVFVFGESAMAIVALEDGHIEGYDIPKGVWFLYAPDSLYNSRLYKEAAIEEIVHQIDQKYIPRGLVVNLTAVDEVTWTSDKTFVEIKQALTNGQFVIVKYSIDGKDYIVSGGSLMPYPEVADEAELIAWRFGVGSSALYCIGFEDETIWQFGAD